MIVEPQLLRIRIPIETDRVADAAGKHFELAAIGLHAVNCGVHVGIRFADVAGRADRDVQPTVRAEGDEFPAVVAVPGKLVEDDDWLRWTPEIGFDTVETQDAADFGDIERTVVERYAVPG